MPAKAEPTPGERKLVGAAFFRVMSGDKVICDVGDVTSSQPARKEDRANGHILAASKELLAGLKFAYTYMRHEAGGPAWIAEIERMRVAIEKAEGKI